MKSFKFILVSMAVFGLIFLSITIARACFPDPPECPENLRARVTGMQCIQLDWTCSISGVEGYEVFRSEDGVNFEQRMTTSLTSVQDVFVEQNTTYYYKVRAFTDTWFSDFSDVVQATGPFFFESWNSTTTPSYPSSSFPSASSGTVSTADNPTIWSTENSSVINCSIRADEDDGREIGRFAAGSQAGDFTLKADAGEFEFSQSQALEVAFEISMDAVGSDSNRAYTLLYESETAFQASAPTYLSIKMDGNSSAPAITISAGNHGQIGNAVTSSQGISALGGTGIYWVKASFEPLETGLAVDYSITDAAAPLNPVAEGEGTLNLKPEEILGALHLKQQQRAVGAWDDLSIGCQIIHQISFMSPLHQTVGQEIGLFDNCERLDDPVDQGYGWWSNTLSLWVDQDDPDNMPNDHSLGSYGAPKPPAQTWTTNAGPQFFRRKWKTGRNTGASIESGGFLNGYLRLWIYVPDVDLFYQSPGGIEIREPGGTDSKEYQWNTYAMPIHQGWNDLKLKLSNSNDGLSENNHPNLNSIGYFRIFFTGLSFQDYYTLKIDDLSVTAEPNTLSTKIFDNCDNLDGWFSPQSNHHAHIPPYTTVMGIDANTKTEGTGSISVSTSDSQIMFQKCIVPSIEPPGVTGGENSNGFLHFSMNASDASHIGNIKVSLGSSASSEYNTYDLAYWSTSSSDLNFPVERLSNRDNQWVHFALPMTLSQSVQFHANTLPSPRLFPRIYALNLFRVEMDLSGVNCIKIDDIYIDPKESAVLNWNNYE